MKGSFGSMRSEDCNNNQRKEAEGRGIVGLDLARGHGRPRLNLAGRCSHAQLHSTLQLQRRSSNTPYWSQVVSRERAQLVWVQLHCSYGCEFWLARKKLFRA